MANHGCLLLAFNWTGGHFCALKTRTEQLQLTKNCLKNSLHMKKKKTITHCINQQSNQWTESAT